MVVESTKAAVSLGRFIPSRLHEQTIARELQAWLVARGITDARLARYGRLPIEVRRPEEHLRIANDPTVTEWHRDGLGKYATYHGLKPASKWIVMWSNGSAPQIRDESGEIPFQPFDVLLIDNERAQHRCPPVEEGRWFVRLLDPIVI
jgi:hypothetical protein